MHLGRTPSRLPPDLTARELGPAAAWERTVDKAVEAGVAAVLLAGDVVDRDDDFFEAYRALEAGVRRLTEAGIEVLGVAGNHDVKVLPRLAQHIPQFRLLGAGGTWESCRLGGNGEAVTVWGWSFPTAGTAGNPLQDRTFDLPAGINLGLLHCDRDAAADSRYAPVASRDLHGARLDGWLLGHIHKPDPLSAESPHGYLGSLTGLDRGEPGARGPWLITVQGGRIAEVEHLHLAPLRWEPLEVRLDGSSDPEDARDRLLGAVKALDARLAALPVPPDAVGLSVQFTGRANFGNDALQKTISEEDRDHLYTGAARTRYFIYPLEADTRPEIDLEELARRPDPVGLLAQRLLWLDRPDENTEREGVLGNARRRLRDQAARAVWSGLEDGGGDVPDPAPWLRRAGLRALDRLLAQQRHGGQDGD